MGTTWTRFWLLAALLSCPLPASAADPGIDPSSPAVSDITRESARITWTTARPSSSQVILIDGQGQFTRRSPEPIADRPRGVLQHAITLTGLVPGRDYDFVVVSADGAGPAARYPAAVEDRKASALHFHTAPFDPAGPTRFRIDLDGPAHVYAGSDLYVLIYPVPLAGKRESLDLSGVAFNPATPALTSHLISGHAHANESDDHHTNPRTGKPTVLNGLSGEIYNRLATTKVRIRTAPNTPPGTYTATFSFASDGVTVNATHRFTVLPPPRPIARKAIDAVPPIPGLEIWKKRMLADGRKFGKVDEKMGFGWEGQIWYYDGGRVYLQIANHTGERDTFLPIARNILDQYADYTALGAPGWRVFPHGLAMQYWRTGDPRMKQGVLHLATKSAMAYSGGNADLFAQRETAYIINAYVKAAQVGAEPNPILKVSVDYALGHLDMLQRPGQCDQPFFDGITLEALIDYYEYTAALGKPDLRIPPAVKGILDWIWEHDVDPATGRMAYQVLGVDGYGLGSGLAPMTSSLNNLIIPAYAWYWNLTGDDIARQRGDFLFQHSIDESREGFWNGKQFSQNYKWSFDYIHYRSSATPVVSLSDPANNPRKPQ